MDVTKLLTFNLKELYSEDFSKIAQLLRVETLNLGNHVRFFDNVEKDNMKT